jgi:aminoglycoside 6-adenylyltransferase
MSSMRTENQVIDQLLAFARDRAEIRAVTMNGSRVNPNMAKDVFCDYDVVYFTTDPGLFWADQSWIKQFGELIILQQNDFDIDGQPGHIFLMLFTDGVRIDLAFDPLAGLDHLAEDTLTVVLLDKDGRIGILPRPSEEGYFSARPSRKEFDETVNEIFWCATNVGKGLWREELPYAKAMYDMVVRKAMLDLLAWDASLLHGWAVNTGKFGKWLQKYLPAEIWDAYVKSYAGAGADETWEALFEMLKLARKVAMPLASAMGYTYPLEDDRRVNIYLQQVRSLPKASLEFPEVDFKSPRAF